MEEPLSFIPLLLVVFLAFLVPILLARLKRLRILRARAVVHTIYASAGRVSEVASLTRASVQDGGVRDSGGAVGGPGG